MKFLQTLLESPIPQDWGSGKLSGKTNPKDRINYAMTVATRIRSGSSRVAFSMTLDGKDVVIKIAKNRKGLSQNKNEVDFLKNPEIVKLGITPKLIDYEQNASEPAWVQVEKAEKISNKEFQEFFKNLPKEKIDETKILAQKLAVLGKHGLKLSDLTAQDNWGKIDGKFVVIDLAATVEYFNTRI